MKENVVLIKEVDKQGRLVLPKEWRKKAGFNKVTIKIEDDKLVIQPYKPADITKFFDSIKVDVKSDLKDWKSVRRDILEVH